MIKGLLVLILGLLLFQGAKAQKDTLKYYMKNSGESVTNKEDADYFMLIMPPDTSTGITLYPVFEYYPNGKHKLMAEKNVFLDHRHGLLPVRGARELLLFRPRCILARGGRELFNTFRDLNVSKGYVVRFFSGMY